MSFSRRLSRFREFVRFGSNHHGSDESEQETSKSTHFSASRHRPDIINTSANHPTVPTLDVAELDGDGARAILMPNDSVFSSTFIAVNRAFCIHFGYDSCEFQSSPLTKLIGATTDTKQLQATWREAACGSEKSMRFDFYDKCGILKVVQVDLMPRSLQVGGSSNMEVLVVVARIHEATPQPRSNIINGHMHAKDHRVPRQVRSSLIYDETLLADDDSIQLETWNRPISPRSSRSAADSSQQLSGVADDNAAEEVRVSSVANLNPIDSKSKDDNPPRRRSLEASVL